MRNAGYNNHYRTHRIDMLRDLDWLSVYQHIIYKIVMFIWDTINGENEDLKKFMTLNSEVYSHQTRSIQNFHIPIQNNKAGQRLIFASGLKL
jgi:hypothetical protein